MSRGRPHGDTQLDTRVIYGPLHLERPSAPVAFLLCSLLRLQCTQIIDTNFPLCFIFYMDNNNLDKSAQLGKKSACGTAMALELAAASCLEASTACRSWEGGGEPGAVTETAAAARAVANIALEAVFTDEPWDRTTDEPKTRQARLAYAAWFALLAGTDEHGTASDRDCAAALFGAAAPS